MILRRRRLWFVVLVGMVLAGCLWVWALSCGLSTGDAAKIKNGMTLEEVVVIFGRPPDYSRRGESQMFHVWEASDGFIQIWLDASKYVELVDAENAGLFSWQLKRMPHKFGIRR